MAADEETDFEETIVGGIEDVVGVDVFESVDGGVEGGILSGVEDSGAEFGGLSCDGRVPCGFGGRKTTGIAIGLAIDLGPAEAAIAEAGVVGAGDVSDGSAVEPVAWFVELIL